jgi:mono/diheme cytochrome c family protein
MRSVNPLNPRVIVFDNVPRDRLSRRHFVAAGFTRGEPVVELATRDETSQQLRFFVVAFRRACDDTKACTLADQLTELGESGWTSVSLYEDVDLENTALDCLRCHQPGGPGTPRMLRMQELRFPWTHFLAPKRESVTGFELARDLFTAHLPSERLGGVPARLLLDASDPGALSQLLAQEGSADQPNEFPGFTITLEREATGTSATWSALLDKASRAEAIPVPWWGLRVTDEATQAETARAFQQALIDSKPEAIVELRGLHTDEVERATGVRPRTGATGREVLVQACGQCHQAARNQALTRARFDALRLEGNSPQERQLAIDRLRLPERDPLHMPPALCGVLTDDEVQRALDALRSP